MRRRACPTTDLGLWKEDEDEEAGEKEENTDTLLYPYDDRPSHFLGQGKMRWRWRLPILLNFQKKKNTSLPNVNCTSRGRPPERFLSGRYPTNCGHVSGVVSTPWIIIPQPLIRPCPVNPGTEASYAVNLNQQGKAETARFSHVLSRVLPCQEVQCPHTCILVLRVWYFCLRLLGMFCVVFFL